MAQTTGFVQRLTLLPELSATAAAACVWIGPSLANSTVLLVQRLGTDPAHAGSFKNSMVDTLTTALVNRREVVATHADTDSLITSLVINSA